MRIGEKVVVRLALIVAVLAGTGVPVTALGQADEDAGTYSAPTYGYELAWDTGDWAVSNERGPTSQSTRDFLRLDSTDANDAGQVASLVFIEGTTEDWDDTDDCLRTVAREIDVRVNRNDPLDDPETDEPFAVSEDGISSAGFIRTFEDDEGSERRQAALFTCVADPDSDLIVAFTHVSGYIRTYFEDSYPAYRTLVDSLTFPGGGTGAKTVSTGESGGEEDAEQIETPATPEPDGGETGESGAGDDGAGTGEWSAPDFGVALTWDTGVWTEEDREAEELYAALRLSSDLLTSAFVPYVSGDGSVQTCLTNYVNILNERGAGTAAILTRDDGSESVTVSEDGTQLSATVGYTAKDVDFVSLILCYSLSETDVLAIEFTGTPDDLASDEAQAQIEALLGNLTSS